VSQQQRQTAESAFVQALRNADARALSRRLAADPRFATEPIDGVPPLLVLLRRSRGSGDPAARRACARVLLDAGADPNSYTTPSYGGRASALLECVTCDDIELAQLLLDRGATVDQEAFEEACVCEEFNDVDDRPFYDLFCCR